MRTTESNKEYYKKWYKENRDRVLAHRRLNYSSEKNTKAVASWRERNKEKWKEYMREYMRKRKSKSNIDKEEGA